MRDLKLAQLSDALSENCRGDRPAGGPRRSSVAASLVGLLLSGCAHGGHSGIQMPAPSQRDCRHLLMLADAARAADDAERAKELAKACLPDDLRQLTAQGSVAERLLWCGRAEAALKSSEGPHCEGRTVQELSAALRPRLTLGPPDADSPEPKPLADALAAAPELNLAWDPQGPDVIVGELDLGVDRSENKVIRRIPGAGNEKHAIQALEHRAVAHVACEIAIGPKTRTLRALEEQRDTTWEAVEKWKIPAKPTPKIASDPQLTQRAVAKWLQTLSRTLLSAIPETVHTDDAAGCVAYALALDRSTGAAVAGTTGAGDSGKIAACEKLLHEPAGAGIPVP